MAARTACRSESASWLSLLSREVVLAACTARIFAVLEASLAVAASSRNERSSSSTVLERLLIVCVTRPSSALTKSKTAWFWRSSSSWATCWACSLDTASCSACTSCERTGEVTAANPALEKGEKGVVPAIGANHVCKHPDLAFKF